jgi:copper transport protein
VPDRRLAAALSLAALAALAVLSAPSAAGWRVLGHAHLVTSSPGSGAVLPDAPGELRLVFSEPLEGGFSSLDLRDAAGAELLSRTGDVDPADRFALVAPLPQLADGVYTVTWRSLSAADGHTTDGFFSFGIGDVGTVPGSGGTHTAGTPLDPPSALLRTLAYAGLLPTLGLATFGWIALRRTPARRFDRLLSALLAIAAVATLAGAAWAAVSAGSPPADYLAGSRTGQLQLARFVVLIAGAAGVAVLAGRGHAASTVATIAALGAVTLMASSGHAAAIGPVAVLGQAVHVAAAGMWLGGVIGLGILAMRPAWVVDGESPPLSTVVPRFSAVAIASIGMVAATGLYEDWVLTGTVIAPDRQYGVTLLIKVAIVAAALGVGAANYLDGGRRPGWLGGTRTRLGAEAALGVAVLAVTAVLSSTSPTETTAVTLAPAASSAGSDAGIELRLEPGRPGVNRAVASVSGALGDRPAELVLLRLDAGGRTTVPLTWQGGIAHGAGHEAPAPDSDEWAADAVVLPSNSRWDATVRILSPDGSELLRQRFAFTLDADGVAEGARGPLVDVSLLVAGMLGAGGALAVGLGAGGWRLPRTDESASRLALVAGGVGGVALGVVIGGSRLLGIG